MSYLKAGSGLSSISRDAIAFKHLKLNFNEQYFEMPFLFGLNKLYITDCKKLYFNTN